MLQFLVDVQLPGCSYHVPQRQTVFNGGYCTYTLREGKLYQGSVECTGLNIPPNPLAFRIAERVYSEVSHYCTALYFLCTNGLEYQREYHGPFVPSGRGSECYSDYLI